MRPLRQHVRNLKMMSLKATILVSLLTLSMAGCSVFARKTMYSENWHLVKNEMTKDDIKEILGEPNSIRSAFKYKNNADPIGKFFVNAMFDGWYEKWYYGKKPSILGTIIPFYPFGVPGKSYIIYFNDKNKVVWHSEPAAKDDDK